MQTSIAELDVKSTGHKSLCLRCEHYDISIVFIPNVKTGWEHICYTDNPKNIPGDCVISCVDFKPFPEKNLVEKMQRV